MNNHYQKSRKSKGESLEVKAVLTLFRGLAWLITLPFRGLGKKSTSKGGHRAVDTQEVTQKWNDIQTTVGLGGVSHFGSAVVSADKLLDHVLKQKGYSGETMGERLKHAEDDVSPGVYQGAWLAHKLRNQLVHEVSGEVMSYQAKEAIQQYEQMLRELGALR